MSKRRLFTSGIAAGVFLGATLIAAPAAQADGYGCAGSLVGAHNIKDGAGNTWGTVNVYYSSANNGTNCAVTVAKRYAGQPHWLEVHLFQGTRAVHQSGLFSYYAGPVSLTGTDGRCITVSGEVDQPVTGNAVIMKWENVHCG